MAARTRVGFTGNGKAKILIVEEHPITRLGLVELIGRQEDMQVCAEVDHAESAIEAIAEHRPDLMTVELTTQQFSGLQLVKRVHASHPDLPILVVSAIDDLQYAVRVLALGARGYVMKREPVEVLVTALRQTLSGQIHVSERVTERLLHRTAEGNRSANGHPLDALSDRELEVFHLVGTLRTREIAQRLNVSVKTVESHRAHIIEKLGLKGATELVQQAVRLAMN